MKTSYRLGIGLGSLFLLFAALLLVSLGLSFFYFDSSSATQNLFAHIGLALVAMYGYSSFLVPLYLFVSGILLFLPPWNAKKAFLLAFSLLPFFTIVFAEKLVKTMIQESTQAIMLLQVFGIFAIALVLLIIEYLSANLVFDSALELFFTNEKPESKSIKTYKEKIQNKASNEEGILENQKLVQPAEALVAELDSFLPLEENVEDFSTEPIDETFPFSDEDFFADESFELEAYEENIVDVFESEEELELEEGVEKTIPSIGTTQSLEHEIDPISYPELVQSPLKNNEPVLIHFDKPKLDILEIAAVKKNDFESEDEEAFLLNPFADAVSKNLDEDEFGSDIEIDLGDLEDEEFDLFDENDEIDMVGERYEMENKEQIESSISIGKKKSKGYKIPAEELLTTYPDDKYWIIGKETEEAAVLLTETIKEFRIHAEVTGIRKGPVITMFEVLPAPGVKLSKIVSLQDNIALRLAASSVRIVAPIPGKSAVGIEVPNKERHIVGFKELIETDHPEYKKMDIPVILGKDITGEAQFLDLTKTPHLLIAGATGSGKSVCVNTMILSILFKRSHHDVKMILIDPKVVELKLYNDIPHLLTPVITEPKKAFQALQYCLCEMERRYALLDGMGVRDIKNYNKRIIERNIATEKLPYIVIIIDEFADLMATTGKELESTVARLAAMSRAVGIHLVLATQRPSIDVITGLIKANIPSRIAFMVASKTDSRIIIDQVGAEKLLGKGDMLYASTTDPFPVRIQGTFVSDSEVENVVEYVKQIAPPEYIDDEIFFEDDDFELESGFTNDGLDPLYDKALEIVVQAGKASASYIQRRLKIGYNRAARIIEDMEARGIVGPQNGSKPREIIHVP